MNYVHLYHFEFITIRMTTGSLYPDVMAKGLRLIWGNLWLL